MGKSKTSKLNVKVETLDFALPETAVRLPAVSIGSGVDKQGNTISYAYVAVEEILPAVFIAGISRASVREAFRDGLQRLSDVIAVLTGEETEEKGENIRVEDVLDGIDRFADDGGPVFDPLDNEDFHMGKTP